MIDVLVPQGDWRVRIMDLSGGNGSDPVEMIKGFESLMHANAFARRYVRDSMERCRSRGMAADAVLQAWFAFGEDAVVQGEGGWSSASEVKAFSETPVTDSEDRNWRALDPRRYGDDEEDDDGDDA